MRVARFCFGPGVATLLALSLAAFPRAARSAGDPPPPAPAAAAAAAAADSIARADSLLTIHLENGDSLLVSHVSHGPTETVRYRTVEGKSGYLSFNRVRDIRNLKGTNHFVDVTRDRKSFGSEEWGEKQSFWTWLAGSPLETPYRERRAYVFLESGIDMRAGSGPSTVDEGPQFMTGIGVLKNLSRSWALGGVAQIKSDGGGYRMGSIGVRLLRYLDDTFAIETTQGLYVDGEQDVPRDRRGIPYFGEIAVSERGTLALFARVELHKYEFERTLFGYYPQKYEASDTALHFGIRLGPRPRFVSVPGALLGAVLFSTSYSSG